MGQKYPGQRPVCPLLIAGQKYAWVRSGQGPSLLRRVLQNFYQFFAPEFAKPRAEGKLNRSFVTKKCKTGDSAKYYPKKDARLHIEGLSQLRLAIH